LAPSTACKPIATRQASARSRCAGSPLADIFVEIQITFLHISFAKVLKKYEPTKG
jgi:hypothetical protein